MVPDYPALLEENATEVMISASAITGTGITLEATVDDDWATATAYAVGDLVNESTFIYRCLVAHTSGTFATDLTADKWELYVVFDPPATGVSNHDESYWQISHPRKDNSVEALEIVASAGAPTTTANTLSGRGTISFVTDGTWDANQISVWRSVDGGTSWSQWRKYNLAGRNVDTSWEENDSSALYSVTATALGESGTFILQVQEFYTRGIVKITSVTDTTHATANVIETLGSTDATTLWAEGAWSAYRGYPKACALWESRLIFAGTLSNPNTLWLSTIDAFQNFELSTLDDGAMKVTIGSGLVDDIVWLVPQTPLVIGTSGSEWVLEAESDNKPVTPSAFSLKRKTTYGSKDLQAVLINSAVLFPMRQGRKLREFTYRFDVDDYVAPDLTILAEHVTEGGITSMAYQQQPDNVLLMTRADGTLVPMTYERDQEVVGLYRWTLDGGAGTFDSVAVISKDSDEDRIWVSCTLTVDGSTKRYVGYFDNREWGTDIATEWTGSDFYTVIGFNEINANYTVASSSDIDVDGEYVYNSSNGKWENSAKSTDIEFTTEWVLSGGLRSFYSNDTSTTPPDVFIEASNSDDSSEAGLLGDVKWYKSEVNGVTVFVDESDTYYRWFDGAHYITTKADYGVTNTNGYKYSDIVVSGAGSESANGGYFLADNQVGGKNAYVTGDGITQISWSTLNTEWILSVSGTPLYINASTSALPPETGWIRLAGDDPAPTLAYSNVFYGYGSWTGSISHSKEPIAVVDYDNIISGFDYLEGKTVDIVRDGLVDPQQVVTGGEITLIKAGASRVVVGLPRTCTMAPMYLEPSAQFQQPMGKKKGVYKAVLRFKDTIHAKVGQSLGRLETLKFRDTEDALDTQVDLFSGEKKVGFANEYKNLHTCYVVQDKPLPIQVIAMIPSVEVYQ